MTPAASWSASSSTLCWTSCAALPGMLRQFRKNFDFFDAPVGMILCVERRMGNGQWIDAHLLSTS